MYVRKSRKNGKRASTRKRSNLRKTVTAIAKTVALRQSETKHIIRNLGVNYTLGHNSWDRVSTNLLYSAQGSNDNFNRIGDEVIARGIKLYCQLESKPTEPMIAWRIIVIKCRNAVASSANPPLRTVTGQTMLDPIDMEQAQKVLLDKVIYNRRQDSTVGLVPEGTVPEEPVDNRRAVQFRKYWIPMNNVKYKYQDNSTDIGRDYNIAMWVSVYSHFTDTMDDTLSRGTFASEFFFKDP